MRILDIDIIDYDSYLDAYVIRYCFEVSNGVFRRTRAIYMEGSLINRKKDNKKELLDHIKKAIKKHNYARRI